MNARPSRAAVVRLALWLGIVGFGGGFAIAQRIKRTVVEEKRWMDEREFVELLSVACALPGTTAANVLALVAHRLAGVRGALVAVAAFLAPSVALMIAFGAWYERARAFGALAAFLDGMGAATVGVVAAVAVDMARSALRRPTDWILALVASVALALRVLSLVEVVAGAALVGALTMRDATAMPPPQEPTRDSFPPGSLRAVMPLGPALALVSMPAALLFVVFARIGLVTFGGGFAMIPAIEHEVVASRGWLTEAAFDDAIVLGQITPGPVAIAATFIGYRVAGGAGAALATLGMFGPPFVLAVIAARSVAAFRTNRAVQGALRGVAPAVVGVIAAAALALARTSAHSVTGAAIAIASGVALVVFRRVPALVPLALGGAAVWLLRR
jgi:chromate transporter